MYANLIFRLNWGHMPWTTSAELKTSAQSVLTMLRCTKSTFESMKWVWKHWQPKKNHPKIIQGSGDKTKNSTCYYMLVIWIKSDHGYWSNYWFFLTELTTSWPSDALASNGPAISSMMKTMFGSSSRLHCISGFRSLAFSRSSIFLREASSCCNRNRQLILYKIQGLEWPQV